MVTVFSAVIQKIQGKFFLFEVKFLIKTKKAINNDGK